MRALISGAGIAGLTLAWHLERAGWDLELVERAPAFRPGGYVIDFFGPGLEVAKSMGLEARLQELRYDVRALRYLNPAGRETSRFVMPGIYDGLFSLMRSDLARAIGEQVRTPVAYDASIAAIRQSDTSVDVLLTDGSHREVDLVVGADGVRSGVRAIAFGPEDEFLRPLDHSVAAFSFSADDLGPDLGNQYHLLSAPGRAAALYALRDGQAAVMFLYRDEEHASSADVRAMVTDLYGDFGWILPVVLERWPADRPYHDEVSQVVMARWSTGRVALVGDACQAVSLFAGQGASMAMAGAKALADRLREGGGNLEMSLSSYEEDMQALVAPIQRRARRSGTLLVAAHQWQITMRDLLVRASALPGVDALVRHSLTPGSHPVRAGGPQSRRRA